jgi:branched-chain amino acid transport system permease protein
MVVFLAVAPFVLYPVFLMKLLCFALFALAFNLLIGYVGCSPSATPPISAWAATSPGTRRRRGLSPELAILGGGIVAGLLGAAFGWIAIRPAGHLLRHDHPGAGADGVLLLRPGALHRR